MVALEVNLVLRPRRRECGLPCHQFTCATMTLRPTPTVECFPVFWRKNSLPRQHANLVVVLVHRFHSPSAIHLLWGHGECTSAALRMWMRP